MSKDEDRDLKFRGAGCILAIVSIPLIYFMALSPLLKAFQGSENQIVSRVVLISTPGLLFFSFAYLFFGEKAATLFGDGKTPTKIGVATYLILGLMGGAIWAMITSGIWNLDLVFEF